MTIGVLMYKFIHVGRNVGLDEHAGKPIYYIFNNKGNYAMGRILYYPAWRQWVATFDEEAVWSTGCLEDVNKAISQIAEKERLA